MVTHSISIVIAPVMVAAFASGAIFRVTQPGASEVLSSITAGQEESPR
jgi:hypothetical protein